MRDGKGGGSMQKIKCFNNKISNILGMLVFFFGFLEPPALPLSNPWPSIYTALSPIYMYYNGQQESDNKTLLSYMYCTFGHARDWYTYTV